MSRNDVVLRKQYIVDIDQCDVNIQHHKVVWTVNFIFSHVPLPTNTLHPSFYLSRSFTVLLSI